VMLDLGKLLTNGVSELLAGLDDLLNDVSVAGCLAVLTSFELIAPVHPY